MKHVGKSTIGRFLASRRNLPFFDLDDEVIRAAAQETKRPLARARDVFEVFGEERFRGIEAEQLRSLCESAETEDAVIALGGGAVERPDSARLLSRSGTIVYLREDLNRVWKRVRQRGLPPYLRSDDPQAEFRALAEERDAAFRSVATRVVELGGRSVAEAVDQVESMISWE
jgi:shikimate kinase